MEGLAGGLQLMAPQVLKELLSSLVPPRSAPISSRTVPLGEQIPNAIIGALWAQRRTMLS